MPLIHVNAGKDGPDLHDQPGRLEQALLGLLAGDGPVILMLHGYKYAPGHARECPHRHILSASPQRNCFKVVSWPRGLGFGDDRTDEGLGIGFGWNARGTLWQAYAEAARAGERLAQLVRLIRKHAPHRPVHAVAHSLGARVVLSALPHLPGGAFGRLILLAGAEFAGRAAEALATPAGCRAEVINVTSRENDFYDFLLECLIPAPARGDRSLGLALPAGPKVLNLQMDHPETLSVLRRAGFEVGDPTARICHWSPYTRPGVFPMYQRLLREAIRSRSRNCAPPCPNSPPPAGRVFCHCQRSACPCHRGENCHPERLTDPAGGRNAGPDRPLLLAHPERLESLHRARGIWPALYMSPDRHRRRRSACARFPRDLAQ